MDSRLTRYRLKKVDLLTAQDIPQLAFAITGYYKGTVTVQSHTEDGVVGVRFFGENVDMILLPQDANLLLEDFLLESFSPILYPTGPDAIKPSFMDVSANIVDSSLYSRVYSRLLTLFGHRFFPTSEI